MSKPIEIALLFAVLGAPLAGARAGQAVYDFGGSSWRLAPASTRQAFRVAGHGRWKLSDKPLAELVLANDRWSLLVAPETPAVLDLQGAWRHPDPGARNVFLELDQVGESLLRGALLARVRGVLEERGVSVLELTADVHSFTGRLRLRPRPAAGTARSRLRVALVARGTLLEAPGSEPVPWVARFHVRGRTEPVPLAGISVPPPDQQLPPVASFVMTSGAGPAPLLVNFQDSSTGPITALHWDFGDGHESVASSPSHLFFDPGTYLVSFVVTGPYGSDEVTRYVTALPESLPPEPAPPQLVLYPALVPQGYAPLGDDPVLLPQLGPHSAFFVGMTPGFGWEFRRRLAGPAEASTRYSMRLAVSSVKKQVLTITLRVRRTDGSETILLGPKTVDTHAHGQAHPYQFSTSSGPAMDAKTGDLLLWTVTNDSPQPDPMALAELRIYLDQSRVSVPWFD